MGGMFKKGYEASREEKARQDKNRENMGKRLFKFFLSDDGDEADLHFLTEEPINFQEHNIKSAGDKFTQYTCTGDDCSLCDDGDKPTYKGAYLVVDRRTYEYEKDGKKQKGKDQVRLFIQGMKVVSQLDRMSTKYGLSNREVTMIRLGKGTQTTYTIEKGDEKKLTKKEIENLLPEKLRDEYDGTMESLYKIVENQLLMYAKDYNPEDSDEDDEEDDTDNRVMGTEDDEDDTPKKPLKSSKSLNKPSQSSTKKSLFKKPQNSIKPQAKTAKSLLRKKTEELPFN